MPTRTKHKWVPKLSGASATPGGYSLLRLESGSALPHPIEEVQGCLAEAGLPMLGQLVLDSLSYMFMEIFISYNCVHVCYLR